MEHDRTRQYRLKRRDGAVEVLTAYMPDMPVAQALLIANRRANGWTEGDDLAEPDPEAPRLPSEAPNRGDVLAVAWAAIGLTRPSRSGDGWPDFRREHRRNIGTYGDAVATKLWREGFRDHVEHLQVGAELLGWIREQLYDDALEVAAEAEGFNGPQDTSAPRSSGS